MMHRAERWRMSISQAAGQADRQACANAGGAPSALRWTGLAG